MKKKGCGFWILAVLAITVVVGGGAIWWISGRMRPGIEVASLAPDVRFTDEQGQPVQLATLRGKFVLLDFWQST